MAVALPDPEAGLGECQFCGTEVTRQFRQVFGDREDVAHRCIQCDSMTRINKGSAAGKDIDHPDPKDEPGRITSGHSHRGRALK